ncbi:MAG TPA: ATP-grasp domain-containing protein [Ignavibacteriaceae bacterium]|nr:ATP-grasp domain-containing protein [Ignavibacteriaceae bacterium]
MENLKIAIVYNEPNPELPQQSAQRGKIRENSTVKASDKLTATEEFEIIRKALADEGFNSYLLNISDDIQVIIKDAKKNKPDVVFNLVEIYKENPRLEMNIVGVLELLKITYTGAPPLALANCQNKELSKKLLQNAGIKTPEFILFDKQETRYKHNLNYPVIVKPAFEDASIGIDNNSVVRNNKELKNRIEYIFIQLSQPCLVEEYIDGRELNAAVIGDKNPVVLPISEIDFSEMPDYLHNIVSYQAKWDPTHESYQKTIPVCPAKLSREIEDAVNKIALKAFRIMGCRDYARVDMRLSDENELYVLEVNPNPDLSQCSGFIRSAAASGLSYSQTMKKIVELAWERRNMG